MKAWGNVFLIAGCVYIAVGTVYNFFGSGYRQPWDNPSNDEVDVKENVDGFSDPQMKEMVNIELNSQKITSQL